jgi:hypothetical protein
MRKWRYSSIILDLGTTCRSVTSFMPRLLYSRRIGGWMGLRVGLNRKIFPLPGFEPRPSNPWPFAIPTTKMPGKINNDMIHI